jgi:hypothetical protein
MHERAMPREALERLMGVLIWGWMNSDNPDFSVEGVAEEGLRAALAYIDENCPEWYRQQWLRAVASEAA